VARCAMPQHSSYGRNTAPKPRSTPRSISYGMLTPQLVNAGVSLETIRRRLGHANAQTVLRYADQRDAMSDAEIRSWRRRKTTGRSGG